MKALEINQIIFWLLFPCRKYFLSDDASFQSQPFLCSNPMGHRLITCEIYFYLSTPKPIFGFLRIQMKDICKIAISELQPHKKLCKGFKEKTMILPRKMFQFLHAFLFLFHPIKPNS